MKRSLSGIQPSGILHLGNYFGAMKQFIDAQNSGEYDGFYFIADYHSLTSLTDPKSLKDNTYNIVLDYLALGLDPNKSTIFLQSDVPEHVELSWLLSNVTPVGLLERGHSYKDKIAKGIFPNTGLLTYPVLMAADILMYDADVVPVGKDQKQHLEMTRDIAMKFNQQYGVELFKLPEPLTLDDSAVIPGVDGQKMSKSYGNTINMSNNNTVHHTIDLMQKIDENRDYLLIAMIDFELSPIKINGKMHNSYLFSTEKVDQIALDIEIEIPKNSKELTYIVIKNHNFMPENFDVGEIISLQTVLSKRFNLENSDENIKYESNFTSSSKGPIDNLWISSNKFEQQSIYRGKSGDKVYITLGNYSKENLDYAVVMFSDWNQVAFNNGSNVKYFNLNPNEKQIFELTLPDINESSLFQVIAFPMPYKITSPTSYDGSLAYGSFKFILEP